MMVSTAGALLLWLCLFPSLSLAWCSGGGSGGGSGGRWASLISPSPPHRHGSCRHYELCPRIFHSSQDGFVDHRHCHHRKYHGKRRRSVKLWSDISNGGSQDDDDAAGNSMNKKMTLERATKLLSTFWSMAFPYYQESQPGRRLFIGMILLTLVNSGVSVAFSYVSKDFWNALSSKDTQEFYSMMLKFGGALVVGAPVSVLYR
jgi:hypothetical protein